MHSAVLQFNVFLALTHLFIATRGTELEAKKTEKSIPSTTADISQICNSISQHLGLNSDIFTGLQAQTFEVQL